METTPTRPTAETPETRETPETLPTDASVDWALARPIGASTDEIDRLQRAFPGLEFQPSPHEKWLQISARPGADRWFSDKLAARYPMEMLSGSGDGVALSVVWDEDDRAAIDIELDGDPDAWESFA